MNINIFICLISPSSFYSVLVKGFCIEAISNNFLIFKNQASKFEI